VASEEIGARLVLDPGTFLATIKEANTALDDLKKNLGEVGLAMDKVEASAAKMGESTAAAGAESTAAAGKSEEAAIVAGDAGVVAAGQHKTALDKVKASTTAADDATKSFSGTLEKLASGPVAKFGKWGIVGALGIGGESIDQYMKYQKSMTQLVTQAGLASSRLPAIMQGGLNIGKSTGLDFNDIANQLYRIVSATSGLKETNKQILALGQSAADIAVLFRVAPGAPTEQVARLFGALTNVGRSGNLQGVPTTAAGQAALLNATVGTGDIRGQDLVGALGRGVLQAGEVVHAQLPDILSWLDLSTRLGSQPSTSGTLIAHAIQMMTGSTEQSKHVMEMIGLSPSQMQQAIAGPGGIASATALLTQHMKTFNPESYYPVFSGNAAGAPSAAAQLAAWGILTPTQQQQWASGQNPTLSMQANGQPFTLQDYVQSQLTAKMFGGARQEVPYASLSQNLPLFQAIEAQILAQSNSGTYNKDLSTALGTPSQQMDIAMRNLQAYSIELGKDLTPALLKFVHGIVDAAKWLSGNRAVLDAIGATLAAFVGLGAAVYVGGKVASVITGLTNFFKGLNALNPFSSGSKTTGLAGNTGALETNTGAITRLTEVMTVADGEGGRGLTGRSIPLGAGPSTSGKTIAVDSAGNAFVQDVEKNPLTAMGAARLSLTEAGATIGAGILTYVQTKRSFTGQAPYNPLHIPADPLVTLHNKTASPGGILDQILHPSRWLDAFGLGGGSTPAPAVSSNQHALNRAVALNNTSTGQAAQQKFMENELARLNTTGVYMGTGSTAYKNQLQLFYANAQKLFGTSGIAFPAGTLPAGGSAAVLQKWLTARETPQQNKANTAALYATLTANAAAAKLKKAETTGGGLDKTEWRINRLEFDVKRYEKLGLSSDQINATKDQLKGEQEHLDKLHNDLSKVSKTTDTQEAKNALKLAIDSNGSTTNGLLQQILTALRTTGVPTTSQSGMVPNSTGNNPARG
jgi:hypothetical protein